MIVGNNNLGTYLPAVLGVPLLVYGIWRAPLEKWMRQGIGRVVKWIFIAAYIAVAVCVAAAAAAIIPPLVTPPDPGADAIVVLGAAVHGDEVTDTLEKRLEKALEYYSQNPRTLIVVTGGMGSGENLSEAEAMRRFLVSRGVPNDSILVEDQARNTRENFTFSKNLLQQRLGTPGKIVFVTNDFHIFRAGAEAEKAGFENPQGLGAPTPILTIPGAWLRESAAIARGFFRGDFFSPAAES